MQKLLSGIRYFQSQIFSQQQEMFRELSKGQHPPTLLVTCSDSRICPTTITQSPLGELFVLRTAGNIIPAYGAVPGGGEAATIEYAVGALKVEDVIVCGHSQCGAMKGLLAPETLDNYPSVKAYLAHAEATRRIIEDHFEEVETAEERLQRTIEQNVLVQLHHLRTHPVVAASTKSGQLRLHAWVYSIESGVITRFDERENRFVELFEKEPAEALAPVA